MKQVFVSYSRRDSEFVLKLTQDLLKAGTDVWLDQLDIPIGVPWDEAIDQALLNCSHVILVVSPDSMGSSNVLDELSYAIDNDKQIIPVVIRDTKLPLRLHRKQAIKLYEKEYDSSLLSIVSRLPQPMKDYEQKAGIRISSRTPAQVTHKRINLGNIAKLSIVADIEFADRVACWAANIHPTLDHLLIGTANGDLMVWDLREGVVAKVGAFGAVMALQFSQDGSYVVISTANGKAHVMNYSAQKYSIETRAVLGDHDSAVHWAAVSPTSKDIATVGDDGIVRIFSSYGALKQEFTPENICEIWGVTYGATDEEIYTVGMDRRVRRWSTTDPNHIVRIGSDLPLYQVVYSVKKGFIAVAGGDSSVRLWKDMDLIRELSGPKRATGQMTFNQDGTLLIVGTYDGEIWGWNLEDNSILFTFQETGAIYRIDFNHDETMLIVAHSKGITIRAITN